MKDSQHVPTLREIAKKAGVSPMTVSRALRNSPEQSARTCRRIQRLARALGWRPNPMVSALMSLRVRQHGARTRANLAVLDPRSDDPSANADHIKGCVRQAHELGYEIEVFPYKPAETSPARLREILLARGVRGIVLMPVPKALSEVAFDFTGFAAATIGYSVATPNLPRVANDTQSSVHAALRKYEERGYRRVGLIMADDANRRMLCLYSGARSTYDRFFARRMRVRELILPDEGFDPAQCGKILDWIRTHRLQGVLSSAYKLHDKLVSAGASIPDDFAYMHLHRFNNSARSISCMDQLRDFIGQKAIDLVAGMIQRNEAFPSAYPHTILTPSAWIEGDTVPEGASAPAPRAGPGGKTGRARRAASRAR